MITKKNPKPFVKKQLAKVEKKDQGYRKKIKIPFDPLYRY